jgi:hypothetical protein
MTAVEDALEQLRTLTESLPFGASIHDLYGGFRELANSRFVIRRAMWLNPFELAAISKWVYLNAHSRAPKRVDWAAILNSYKYLWKATEEQANYPDDPAVIASFVLRFVYQQLTWNITQDKMQANFLRARGIFGSASQQATELRRRFESAAGLGFEDFLKAAHVLYGLFLRSSSFSDYQLVEAMRSRFNGDAVAGTLRVLSCTRAGYRKYYESRAAAHSASGVVYEFNPLLRYPILLREDRYACVFPELINYVATRGLYFFIADLAGASFNAAFADAFESYVSTICGAAYGAENVLTEAQERALAWTGKTNDVSVIWEDAAILMECKNSGLFSVSKRSANPVDLAADIRKNLANAEKRKGLFQLHDKIESIRNGQMPPPLHAKYASVRKFYPVLLLHDEIWFANRPETMKNLIDAELSAHGVNGFEYQIWHIEELELLLKAVPKDQVGNVLHEKFTDPRYRSLDLTAYLSGRFGLPDLKIHLFLPHGDSKALKIIRKLADADN